MHAYEDPGRPEGGHAILLLQGLKKAPEAIAFRLRPGDATAAVDAAGWPGGDLRPVASRMTGDGLELVVGPDVTESELLLPGTLVEIELPGADARGEFLWPNVAPMLRPKRRTVIVNTPKPTRPAAETSKEAAKPDVVAGAEAAATTAARAAASTPAPQAAASAAGADGKMEAQAAATSAALPSDGMTIKDTSVPMPPPAAAPAMAAADTVTVTATAPARRALAAGASLRGGPIVETSADVPVLQPSRAAPPQATLRGAPLAAEAEARAGTVRPTRAATSDGYYPHARGGVVAPAKSAPAARSRGALLQAGIGVLAVAAAFFVLSRESTRRVAPQPAADPATTVALAPPPAGAPVAAKQPAAATSINAISASGDTAAAAASTTLYEALNVGALSPRGASAAGVGPSKALENANAQLAAASRDADEAGFWLKRYIAQTIGNDRTTRALTQLGSVYAEPSSGAPDYVKARLVWEIASAAGDPVAMCFLGLLHENGLGITADRRVALAWYERSKQVGGCPSVDDAIARVRQ